MKWYKMRLPGLDTKRRKTSDPNVLRRARRRWLNADEIQCATPGLVRGGEKIEKSL